MLPPSLQAEAGTRLILIRHGQIKANISKLWYGSTDGALTEMGIEQAEKLGQHLLDTTYKNHEQSHRPVIYSSPLKRAHRTAEIVSSYLAAPIQIEAGLAEYSLGALEGVSFEKLSADYRVFEKMHADIHYAPPGGESIFQVTHRMFYALQQIISTHPGKKVMIVSHGALMALTFAILFHQTPYEWGQYKFHNTSVSEILFTPHPELVRFNEIDHLAL